MRRLACFALLLTSTACPASSDGDGDDTTSGGSTGESASTASSMSSTSVSTSDSTSASTGMTTTADPTTVSTTDDPTASETTTSVDTSTAEAESTAGDDPCVALSREECNADDTCKVITCRPYVISPDGVAEYCLGEQEFLGCQSAEIGCDDARTVACLENASTYVCPDSCIPAGSAECEPPVEGQIPDCMG